MKKEYIIALIKKLEDGGIEPHEESILTAWLEKNEAPIPSFDSFLEKDLVDFQQRIKTKTKKAKTQKLFPYRKWVAIAASILLVAIVGTWLVESPEVTQTRILAEVNNQELLLPDNSRISMEKGSVITYNSNYAIDNRNVELEGSAFFEVEKDKNNPFIIKTISSETRVIGTKFFLKDEANDSLIYLDVTEGMVSISVDGENENLRGAGEDFFYDKVNKRVVEVKGYQNQNFWLTNQLVFKDSQLSEVIEAVQSNYNIKINGLKDISNCKLTSTFSNLSVDEIIEILALTYQGNWKKNGPKTFTLNNLICN